jgi:DNA-binding helix-hairpin-helix protein with protein kinase domain
LIIKTVRCRILTKITTKLVFFCFLDFLKNAERKRHGEEVTFDKLIMISENIASGMAELVRLGIVHRDLAARNVMVDKWLQVSIIRCVFGIVILLFGIITFGIKMFSFLFLL